MFFLRILVLVARLCIFLVSQAEAFIMRKLASARMDHSRTLKNQARCQAMNTVGAAHSSAVAYMYIHL